MFVRIPCSVIASYNVGVNRAANHQNPARICENVCKQFNDQIAGNVAAPRHPDLLFASQKPINTRSKLANDFVPFLGDYALNKPRKGERSLRFKK